MTRRIVFRGVVRDVIIIGVGIVAIWLSLSAVFGTQNPFYVVASGSMIPALDVYDVLIVQGHAPLEEVSVGDIIVFNRPVDHERVIVHRVVSITDNDPVTLRTKGDANSASIPGTDYPITESEYIGTVVYVIPDVGYITQAIKPPINYIIIVVIIGMMVAKQVFKKKKERAVQDAPEQTDDGPYTSDEPADASKADGAEDLKHVKDPAERKAESENHDEKNGKRD